MGRSWADQIVRSMNAAAEAWGWPAALVQPLLPQPQQQQQSSGGHCSFELAVQPASDFALPPSLDVLLRAASAAVNAAEAVAEIGADSGHGLSLGSELDAELQAAQRRASAELAGTQAAMRDALRTCTLLALAPEPSPDAQAREEKGEAKEGVVRAATYRQLPKLRQLRLWLSELDVLLRGRSMALAITSIEHSEAAETLPAGSAIASACGPAALFGVSGASGSSDELMPGVRPWERFVDGAKLVTVLVRRRLETRWPALTEGGGPFSQAAVYSEDEWRQAEATYALLRALAFAATGCEVGSKAEDYAHVRDAKPGTAAVPPEIATAALLGSGSSGCGRLLHSLLSLLDSPEERERDHALEVLSSFVRAGLLGATALRPLANTLLDLVVGALWAFAFAPTAVHSVPLREDAKTLVGPSALAASKTLSTNNSAVDGHNLRCGSSPRTADGIFRVLLLVRTALLVPGAPDANGGGSAVGASTRRRLESLVAPLHTPPSFPMYAEPLRHLIELLAAAKDAELLQASEAARDAVAGKVGGVLEAASREAAELALPKRGFGCGGVEVRHIALRGLLRRWPIASGVQKQLSVLVATDELVRGIAQALLENTAPGAAQRTAASTTEGEDAVHVSRAVELAATAAEQALRALRRSLASRLAGLVGCAHFELALGGLQVLEGWLADAALRPRLVFAGVLPPLPGATTVTPSSAAHWRPQALALAEAAGKTSSDCWHQDTKQLAVGLWMRLRRGQRIADAQAKAAEEEAEEAKRLLAARQTKWRLAWHWHYTPSHVARAPNGRATAPGWPYGWKVRGSDEKLPVCRFPTPPGNSSAKGWWSDGGDTPATLEFGGVAALAAAAAAAAVGGRDSDGQQDGPFGCWAWVPDEDENAGEEELWAPPGGGDKAAAAAESAIREASWEGAREELVQRWREPVAAEDAIDATVTIATHSSAEGRGAAAAREAEWAAARSVLAACELWEGAVRGDGRRTLLPRRLVAGATLWSRTAVAAADAGGSECEGSTKATGRRRASVVEWSSSGAWVRPGGLSDDVAATAGGMLWFNNETGAYEETPQLLRAREGEAVGAAEIALVGTMVPTPDAPMRLLPAWGWERRPYAAPCGEAMVPPEEDDGTRGVIAWQPVVPLRPFDSDDEASEEAAAETWDAAAAVKRGLRVRWLAPGEVLSTSPSQFHPGGWAAVAASADVAAASWARSAANAAVADGNTAAIASLAAAAACARISSGAHWPAAAVEEEREWASCFKAPDDADWVAQWGQLEMHSTYSGALPAMARHFAAERLRKALAAADAAQAAVAAAAEWKANTKRRIAARQRMDAERTDARVAAERRQHEARERLLRARGFGGGGTLLPVVPVAKSAAAPVEEEEHPPYSPPPPPPHLTAAMRAELPFLAAAAAINNGGPDTAAAVNVLMGWGKKLRMQLRAELKRKEERETMGLPEEDLAVATVAIEEKAGQDIVAEMLTLDDVVMEEAIAPAHTIATGSSSDSATVRGGGGSDGSGSDGSAISVLELRRLLRNATAAIMQGTGGPGADEEYERLGALYEAHPDKELSDAQAEAKETDMAAKESAVAMSAATSPFAGMRRQQLQQAKQEAEVAAEAAAKEQARAAQAAAHGTIITVSESQGLQVSGRAHM